MRLCIIGSSHCAALGDGWEEVKGRYPGTEIHIFAAPRQQVLETRLTGSELVPETEKLRNFFQLSSGGRETINVQQYDRFLLYALQKQAEIFQDDASYSEAVMQASRSARVLESPEMVLARRLRECTSAPIDVALSPYRRPVGGRVPAEGSVAEENAAFARLWAEAVPGARFVPQPPETVLTGRATIPDYGSGTRRLSTREGQKPIPHKSHDDVHANAEYGAIWISRYLEGLQHEELPA
ncbi:hypothetical protein [Pseudoroseicyclus tamaricis]|uniref:Uncharacterized protein n=1 Tax=Pseudoroseicyclus tamaricis TaxID=2705421 RepID=A0A6B2K197_9RHOB|nr:hypothetical protein [Pseudoroseicyclus tamaricis]NDV02214.1 hypothetical protein [Pseudoroseicyclus tamaricis]